MAQRIIDLRIRLVNDTESLLTLDPQRIGEFFSVCPRGRTCTGFSKTLGERVAIATKCGTFSCPHCGPRKVASMAIKCELAHPNRLITLTLRPTDYENPRQAFDQSRRQVSELAKVVRLHVGEFEYLRVLEATAAGWPHYHLVVRSPFVQQRWLSQAWARLAKAPIVDIRAIDQRHGVFTYVCKYLAKQQHVPWTKRRISWTKGFFVKQPPDDRPALELEKVQMHRQHIAQWVADHCSQQLVQAIGPNLFTIKEYVRPGPPAALTS